MPTLKLRWSVAVSANLSVVGEKAIARHASRRRVPATMLFSRLGTSRFQRRSDNRSTAKCPFGVRFLPSSYDCIFKIINYTYLPLLSNFESLSYYSFRPKRVVFAVYKSNVYGVFALNRINSSFPFSLF